MIPDGCWTAKRCNREARSFALVIDHMIEKRRQDIREHLEDPDDENAHKHPLPYLLRQRRFHDLPEEQAERGDDGSDNDRRPDCEALAEYPFIHLPIPLSAQPPTASSYRHSYPAARSRAPDTSRWPPCGWGSR